MRLQGEWWKRVSSRVRRSDSQWQEEIREGKIRQEQQAGAGTKVTVIILWERKEGDGLRGFSPPWWAGGSWWKGGEMVTLEICRGSGPDPTTKESFFSLPCTDAKTIDILSRYTLGLILPDDCWMRVAEKYYICFLKKLLLRKWMELSSNYSYKNLGHKENSKLSSLFC